MRLKRSHIRSYCSIWHALKSLYVYQMWQYGVCTQRFGDSHQFHHQGLSCFAHTIYITEYGPGLPRTYQQWDSGQSQMVSSVLWQYGHGGTVLSQVVSGVLSQYKSWMNSEWCQVVITVHVACYWPFLTMFFHSSFCEQLRRNHIFQFLLHWYTSGQLGAMLWGELVCGHNTCHINPWWWRRDSPRNVG
jgi:hypothetical protein